MPKRIPIFANQDGEDFFVGNLDDERVAALHARDGRNASVRGLWFTTEQITTARRCICRTKRSCTRRSPAIRGPMAISIRAEIPLAGRHNVQNAMAALLARPCDRREPERLRARRAFVSPDAASLERSREFGGVRYVDDSKSTNPGSVIAALDAYDRPVILIAGGRSKGTDFRGMGDAISRSASR